MAEPVAKVRANIAEFSVSELAGAIKGTLEDRFGYVRLRGEISGYRGPHSSGHCYFGLKDDKAKIDAVIWRGSFQKLRFKPAEGLEVIAHGKITTFPGSSKYQIVIEAMEPAGVGALMALLEERKKMLAAEGLFDDSRKRRLPFLPRVVGLVTSPTGAVIRDMLFGFNERFPAHVIVWPVRVQGETSAAEVATAIRGFNAMEAGGRLPRPDVLIVARGGGSLEDLWSFNEEVVVRAAAESRIPLISAVGHETDWTLLDLVADARAPTPTKAAEWAVPDFNDLVDETAKYRLRLGVAARKLVEARRIELKATARGLPRPEDLIALPRQRFDTAQMRLGRALLANTRAHAMRMARVATRLQPRLLEQRLGRIKDRLDLAGRRGRDALARLAGHRRARFERCSGRLSPTAAAQRLSQGRERLAAFAMRAERGLETLLRAERRRLSAQAQMLASLSYQSVLQRGFALVRDGKGRALRSVDDVAAGAVLDVEVVDGRFAVRAEAVTPADRGPGEGGAGGSSRADAIAAHSAVRSPRPARTDRGRPGGSQGSLF